MATTIKLKNGSGAPLAGDLVAGEPALDLTNKRLYTEDSGGTVIEVGTNPTSLTTGTFTSTGIDDNATSTAITIDSSQNVGIGVSPEAWNTYTPIQVQQSSLSSFTNGDARLSNNAYYSSGWKYIDSRYATQYLMDASNGVHTWSTAASGTADGAITWSERMRIDSSGNVGIGTTSPFATARLQVNTGTNLNLAIQTGTTETSGMKINAFNDAATANIPLELNGSVTLLKTGETERMRIDSSGNVGIGTTSPQSYTGYKTLHVAGPTTTGSGLLYLTNSDSSVVGLAFAEGSQSRVTFGSQTNHPVTFLTNDTERMRIDSSGNLLVGTTSLSADERLSVKKATNGGVGVAYFENTGNANGDQGMRTVLGANADNTTSYHYVGRTGISDRIYIFGNGSIVNTYNSYGALSDERLKSNIVDASSQIDDIMAVQVRRYTLKETGETQIGVVAQELEASGMSGLVQENEKGMKSVKYSILYMKAIKALQEAVTRIETLEAEVAALKGA
jgi:hypothetical protein